MNIAELQKEVEDVVALLKIIEQETVQHNTREEHLKSYENTLSAREKLTSEKEAALSRKKADLKEQEEYLTEKAELITTREKVIGKQMEEVSLLAETRKKVEDMKDALRIESERVGKQKSLFDERQRQLDIEAERLRGEKLKLASYLNQMAK